MGVAPCQSHPCICKMEQEGVSATRIRNSLWPRCAVSRYLSQLLAWSPGRRWTKVSGLMWEGVKVQLKCPGLVQGASLNKCMMHPPHPNQPRRRRPHLREEQSPSELPRPASATSSPCGPGQGTGPLSSKKGTVCFPKTLPALGVHTLFCL